MSTLRIKGLIVLVFLLGAQFHVLADLNSSPSGPHVCPICSALSAAVPQLLPILGSLPLFGLAQPMRSTDRTVNEMFRLTAPRAPPFV
jgi:hypothetical protein